MLKKLLSLALSFSLIASTAYATELVGAVQSVVARPSHLPQFDLIPPSNLGRISDYYNAPATKERAPKLVILIQDLHAHYGVQKNIAGLLEFISHKLPAANSPDAHTGASELPFAVGLEGFSGAIDNTLLALYPDRRVKLAAADYLMRQGELTGAEYFAIGRGLPAALTGVENDNYYTIHRDLFRKTYPDRTKLVIALHGIQAQLATVVPHVYSRRLSRFSRREREYDQGDLLTEDYLGFLLNQTRMSDGHPLINRTELKKNFPRIFAFTDQASLQTSSAAGRSGIQRLLAPNYTPIADQLLQTETADFLRVIQPTLTTEEQANLSLLAKASNPTNYYRYLRDLVYTHELFLAIPSELGKYLEYLHTTQTEGLAPVLHEAHELAFLVKERLTKTQRERDLIQVEHDLDLLARLTDLQATEDEVRSFAPHLNKFVALCQALLSPTSVISTGSARPTVNLSTLSELISSSIDFYVMAMLRNEPMLKNTLAQIGASGTFAIGTSTPAVDAPSKILSKSKTTWVKKHQLVNSLGQIARLEVDSPNHQELNTAVLITGGFHTSTLAKLLRTRKVSYLVITPRVNEITNADRELYIARLNGEELTEAELLHDAMIRAPKVASSIAAANSALATGRVVSTEFVLTTLFTFSAIARGRELNQSAYDWFLTNAHRLPMAVQKTVNGWERTHPDGFWEHPVLSTPPVAPSVTSDVPAKMNTPIEDRINESETASLAARHAEFEALVDVRHTPVQKLREGREPGSFTIHADLGLSVPAYFFHSAKLHAHVFVINSRLPRSFGNEALFTAREEVSLLDTERLRPLEAHRLAAYAQAYQYGNAGAELTPVQAWSLKQMTADELTTIADGMARDGTNPAHSDHFFEQQTITRIARKRGYPILKSPEDYRTHRALYAARLRRANLLTTPLLEATGVNGDKARRALERYVARTPFTFIDLRSAFAAHSSAPSRMVSEMFQNPIHYFASRVNPNFGLHPVILEEVMAIIADPRLSKPWPSTEASSRKIFLLAGEAIAAQKNVMGDVNALLDHQNAQHQREVEITATVRANESTSKSARSASEWPQSESRIETLPAAVRTSPEVEDRTHLSPRGSPALILSRERWRNARTPFPRGRTAVLSRLRNAGWLRTADFIETVILYLGWTVLAIGSFGVFSTHEDAATHVYALLVAAGVGSVLLPATAALSHRLAGGHVEVVGDDGSTQLEPFSARDHFWPLFKSFFISSVPALAVIALGSATSIRPQPLAGLAAIALGGAHFLHSYGWNDYYVLRSPNVPITRARAGLGSSPDSRLDLSQAEERKLLGGTREELLEKIPLLQATRSILLDLPLNVTVSVTQDQESKTMSAADAIKLASQTNIVVRAIHTEPTAFTNSELAVAARKLPDLNPYPQEIPVDVLVHFISGYVAEYSGNPDMLRRLALSPEIAGIELGEHQPGRREIHFVPSPWRTSPTWPKDIAAVIPPTAKRLSTQTDMAGMEVYHGTLRAFEAGVRGGPKNVGKGFGGRGLYLGVQGEAGTARFFAEWAESEATSRMAQQTESGLSNPLTARAEQGIVMTGRISKLLPLRVGVFSITRSGPTDLSKAVLNATWDKDSNLRKVLETEFDVLDIRNMADAGLAIGTNRVLIFHESAGPGAIEWYRDVLRPKEMREPARGSLYIAMQRVEAFYASQTKPLGVLQESFDGLRNALENRGDSAGALNSLSTIATALGNDKKNFTFKSVSEIQRAFSRQSDKTEAAMLALEKEVDRTSDENLIAKKDLFLNQFLQVLEQWHAYFVDNILPQSPSPSAGQAQAPVTADPISDEGKKAGLTDAGPHVPLRSTLSTKNGGAWLISRLPYTLYAAFAETPLIMEGLRFFLPADLSDPATGLALSAAFFVPHLLTVEGRQMLSKRPWPVIFLTALTFLVAATVASSPGAYHTGVLLLTGFHAFINLLTNQGRIRDEVDAYDAAARAESSIVDGANHDPRALDGLVTSPALAKEILDQRSLLEKAREVAIRSAA